MTDFVARACVLLRLGSLRRPWLAERTAHRALWEESSYAGVSKVASTDYLQHHDSTCRQSCTLTASPRCLRGSETPELGLTTPIAMSTTAAARPSRVGLRPAVISTSYAGIPVAGTCSHASHIVSKRDKSRRGRPPLRTGGRALAAGRHVRLIWSTESFGLIRGDMLTSSPFATQPDDLAFSKGDMITILEESTPEWWQGTIRKTSCACSNACLSFELTGSDWSTRRPHRHLSLQRTPPRFSPCRP